MLRAPTLLGALGALETRNDFSSVHRVRREMTVTDRKMNYKRWHPFSLAEEPEVHIQESSVHRREKTSAIHNFQSITQGKVPTSLEHFLQHY
jgi:hypothetical protein